MSCSLPARLLCPWDSPGKNTAVGCRALLQGIFPTQGWNLCLSCLLACSLLLALPGRPRSFITLHLKCHPSAGASVNHFEGASAPVTHISPLCCLDLIIPYRLECEAQGNRRGSVMSYSVMLGKTEGRRRRGRQKTRWLDGITS